MEIKSIVDQSFWDQGYENLHPYVANDSLSKWLYDVYFNKRSVKGHTAFEIGCFPGRYLAHFALNKMQISGIDQTPGILNMEKWAHGNNYNSGIFYNEDLLSTVISEKYDLVCSFGFIEHFDDYEYIIKKHIELNKNDGTIIITTPNFKGWGQYLLHLLFDSENLKRHNIKAMNPNKWAKYLTEQGYHIEHKSYFGKFDFWFDSEVHGVRKKLRNIFMKNILLRLKRRIKFDSTILSPFCGIVAVRKN